MTGVHFSYQLVSFLLRLLLGIVGFDVLFEAGISLADYALDRCEFARALLDAHLETATRFSTLLARYTIDRKC